MGASRAHAAASADPGLLAGWKLAERWVVVTREDVRNERWVPM